MGPRRTGRAHRLLLLLLAVLLLGLPAASAQPTGRDPFVPLVTKPKPESPEAKEAVPIAKIKLVGIIWDRERTRAMVETPEGLGYVLKENDEVFGGKVVAIQRDRVRFLVREDGEAGKPATRTVELKLHPLE